MSHPTAYDLARELELDLRAAPSVRVACENCGDFDIPPLGIDELALLEKHLKSAIELGRKMERESAAQK